MWNIYDRLIETIEDDIYAEEVVTGLSWTATKSKGLGLAMSPPRQLIPSSLPGKCCDRSIKELAQAVKSWNLMEAAIGMSAINSALNTAKSVDEMVNRGAHRLETGSAFELFHPYMRGKKVGVIGHFANLDKLKKDCDVTVFERDPSFNDLPDSAAEYLLPEQDFVFITASSLINKTTPRLLELSERAVTIMLGPSTPISPVLFDMGIDMISGSVAKDPTSIMNIIKEGGGVRTYRKNLDFVNLSKASLPELV